MSDILHQLKDALAGAAFAGEQSGLLEGHPIPDRPLAFWDSRSVPCGHIQPLQRLGLNWRVIFNFFADYY
jgi:hypothetical protein